MEHEQDIRTLKNKHEANIEFLTQEHTIATVKVSTGRFINLGVWGQARSGVGGGGVEKLDGPLQQAGSNFINKIK